MRSRLTPYPADAETQQIEQTIRLSAGDILEIVDVSGWEEDDHTLVDDRPYGSWLSSLTPV